MKFFRFRNKENSDALEMELLRKKYRKTIASMPKDILEAHKHSSDKDEILASKKCACFYCFARFTSDKVEWVGRNDLVGLCPDCNVDAVLGDRCGYDLSDDFLKEMHKHWFEITVSF